MSIEWPPDEPAWIDVRAMLEAGGARFGDGIDYVVCDVAPCYAIAVVGRPAADLLAQALEIALPRAEVLAQDANLEYVTSLLPEYRSESFTAHVLGPKLAPIPQAPPCRRLTVDDSLEHLPERMRSEMLRARQHHAVFSAFEDGRAVSFAYAHRQTQTLADVSIDTVTECRRKGYAQVACLQLLHELADRGLRPTWAAYQSNEASLSLATKLGFEPVGQFWGLTLPPTT